MGLKFCKRLDFDVQVRTKKKEWILASALAIKNSITKAEAQRKIKSVLEEIENGISGTYIGTDKQFNSFYTFLLEFGVISNTEGTNYELSELALELVNLNISPKDYISKVLINFIEIIDGKTVNILKEVLLYLKEKNTLTLSKDDIKSIKLFNFTGEPIEKVNNATNQLFTYLECSNYFSEKDKKTLVFNKKYNLQKLINDCNIPEDIESLNNQISYSKYLTTSKEKKEIIKVLPYQKIVYGAPGTGKSYSLNQEVENIFGTNKERVTFYDGYTYGQLIGMYKPTMTEKGDISYKYIPGPFMKQLVKAYKDSSNKFCLIIEEINRAKADKVFGNIFQLLDRNEEGNSRYSISASEEQIQYLSEELKDKLDILERIESEGLYLPDNLYIWATMNSADDGVQPLDTAFKRRWKFNYISLNANEDKFGNGETFIIGQYKDKDILWNEFRTTLNDTLKANITEDRLIAPFFISPNDFEEIDTSIKKIDKNILSEKVLMYIFDDLLRHYPKLRKEIFHNDVKTFSDIHEKVTENENFLELIFNEGFLSQILGSDGIDGKD